MAHFAQLDNQNIVRNVIAVDNAAINNLPFPESEAVGQAMLLESGFSGTWLQCSLNGNFRGAYPGQGWSYDSITDSFVSPTRLEEYP